MNWQQLLWNILGAAAVAFGTALANGASPETAGLVAAGAAVTNGIGLFQRPPHAR